MVSIIVPIYNLEQYCSYCIDSLLAQTYENIEILLIDDGSKDRSLAICQEYAERDSRIRVIHQENQGVSAARNRGLDEARGDYIMFVDGDDIVAPNIVERLRGCMTEEIRLVQCGYQTIHRLDVPIQSPKSPESIFSGSQALKDFLNGKLAPAVSAKLFYAADLQALQFPLGKRSGEDKFFLFQFLLSHQDASVCTCADGLYGYYRRPMSATTAPYAPYMLDMVDLAEETQRIILKHSPKYAEEAKHNLFRTYLIILRTIVLSRLSVKHADFISIKKSLINLGMPKTKLDPPRLIEYVSLKFGSNFYRILVSLFYFFRRKFAH